MAGVMRGGHHSSVELHGFVAAADENIQTE
jgi:hypothetical protein